MTVERNVKGLLGTKLGMTQMWDDNNRIVPVTVVAASTNVVTQVRKPESDGYNAIQVGFGEIDGRKVTKPRAGQFEKAGVTPRRHLAEIRTADAASYTVGQELAVDTFAAGEEIDVTGTTKGKGFAGVMKRHGFHGVGASHGAHRNHRKPGSIGACATPGRVFKGVRMAGRMGSRHRHHPERHRPRGRRREGPDPAQGRRSRPQGRPASSSARPPSARRRRPDHGDHQEGCSRPAGRQGRPPRRDLRRRGQHPADPPGRGGPAGRRPPGHPRHQDAAARSAAVAASPTSRRAPAAPARARPALRSSPVVASSTARSRAATTSARPRR